MREVLSSVSKAGKSVLNVDFVSAGHEHQQGCSFSGLGGRAVIVCMFEVSI
jgi:hypothetical protein